MNKRFRYGGTTSIAFSARLTSEQRVRDGEKPARDERKVKVHGQGDSTRTLPQAGEYLFEAHLRDDAGDCIRPVIRMSRVRIKASTVFEIGNQLIEPAGANMIEITVLLLGVYGVLAVPDTFPIDGNPVGMASSPLPGSANLDEKALPLSKLVLNDQPYSPGGSNPLKQTRETPKLPGTKNLSEKRIPLLILEKLSRPAGIEAWNSSYLRV
ncbi:uncharacterized protein LOC143215448 [Lasioglossum baleicum]|uniref:uncharacterized protein LOC143215448 n=1 Tax=Lasioglossum baleicum TaxID=434251 RepID=UPI003FCD06FF